MPLGWLALRVRHHTFVVISIGMLFTFQLLAYNLRGFTQGSSGILLPFPPWSADIFNLPFYYVALAIALGVLGVSWWIRSSKYGLGLLAIRDDEERVAGLGVPTRAYKLTAFTISAFFAGMIGGMVVYYLGSIFPDVAFDPVFNVTVALMAFLGGAGTLAGPILGALISWTTPAIYDPGGRLCGRGPRSLHLWSVAAGHHLVFARGNSACAAASMDKTANRAS